MTRDTAVQDQPIVSRDRVIDVVRRALQLEVNIKRTRTVEQIAADSGLKVGTVRSYMRGDDAREPCLSSALSLLVVLGTPAVNAALALIGYGGASPLDEADELQPMMLAATAMSGLAVIAQAAADGRIDHTERPACREAADLIIATVMPLASAGSAA